MAIKVFLLPHLIQCCIFFLRLGVLAQKEHWYKAYDGKEISFQLSGPQFIKKKAKYFQLILVITDEEISNNITDYSIQKESRESDRITIILQPENYQYPNMNFPRYIHLQDVIYRNYSMNLRIRMTEILPFPIVLNGSRYDPHTNELIILGKNLIGARAVHLRFDPFMLYGIDYVDASSYPLESDEVILHIFNLPRKVNLDPSSLYLTHIDTGAGLERLRSKVCLVTCDLQDTGSSFQAISDPVRKNRVCVLFERAKKAIARLRDLIENVSRRVIQKARDCIHYAWNYSLFALLKGLFSNVSVTCGDLL